MKKTIKILFASLSILLLSCQEPYIEPKPVPDALEGRIRTQLVVWSRHYSREDSITECSLQFNCDSLGLAIMIIYGMPNHSTYPEAGTWTIAVTKADTAYLKKYNNLLQSDTIIGWQCVPRDYDGGIILPGYDAYPVISGRYTIYKDPILYHSNHLGDYLVDYVDLDIDSVKYHPEIKNVKMRALQVRDCIWRNYDYP